MKNSALADMTVDLRRHLRFGWWALLVYLTLGMVLEILHGFKVEWYLRVSNETRRLMWTLAHAHGTLLSLVNLAFAFALPHLAGWSPKRRAFASASLLGATILLPGGFLLGGLKVYSGDPGLGILLVPAGAALLFFGVLLTAQAAMSKAIEVGASTEAVPVPRAAASSKGGRR